MHAQPAVRAPRQRLHSICMQGCLVVEMTRAASAPVVAQVGSRRGQLKPLIRKILLALLEEGKKRVGSYLTASTILCMLLPLQISPTASVASRCRSSSRSPAMAVPSSSIWRRSCCTSASIEDASACCAATQPDFCCSSSAISSSRSVSSLSFSRSRRSWRFSDAAASRRSWSRCVRSCSAAPDLRAGGTRGEGNEMQIFFSTVRSSLGSP